MNLKRLSVFAMLIAYAIVLGHAMVPHHHEQDHPKHVHEHGSSAHHHGEHQHDHDQEGLTGLFSLLEHAPGGITFTGSHSFSNSYFKQLPVTDAFVPEIFTPGELPVPPLLFRSVSQSIFCSPPHLQLAGLRAPPVL